MYCDLFILDLLFGPSAGARRRDWNLLESLNLYVDIGVDIIHIDKIITVNTLI